MAKEKLNVFKRFGNFIKLTNYSTESEQKIIDPIEEQKIAYSKEIDQYLDSNLISLVFDIQQKGYALNNRQQYLLNKSFFNKVLSEEEFDVKEVKSLLEKGFKYPDKVLQEFILDTYTTDKFYLYHKIKEYFPLQLKNPKFINELFNTFFDENSFYFLSAKQLLKSLKSNTSFLSSDFISSYFDREVNSYITYDPIHKKVFSEYYNNNGERIKKNTYNINFYEFQSNGQKAISENLLLTIYSIENFCKLFTIDSFQEVKNHISLSQYLKVSTFLNLAISQLKQISQLPSFSEKNKAKSHMETLVDYKTLIETQMNNYFTEDKNNILSKANDINIHNFLEQKVVINSINNANDLKLDSLPIEAKNIIVEIELNIKKYFSFKDKLSTENLQTINILKDKRIPEILEKYLKMDPEYQINLKNNQGKNAQEIMIESLQTINDKLKKDILELNMTLLSSLTADNNYLQQVTKPKP